MRHARSPRTLCPSPAFLPLHFFHSNYYQRGYFRRSFPPLKRIVTCFFLK